MIAATIMGKGALSGGCSGPGAPVASFVPSDTDSWVGGNVYFQDTSTGHPTAWEWSYAGGVWSNMQNPTFYFTLPGQYLFYLKASNTFGSSNYGPIQIDVAGIPP